MRGENESERNNYTTNQPDAQIVQNEQHQAIKLQQKIGETSEAKQKLGNWKTDKGKYLYGKSSNRPSSAEDQRAFS